MEWSEPCSAVDKYGRTSSMPPSRLSAAMRLKPNRNRESGRILKAPGCSHVNRGRSASISKRHTRRDHHVVFLAVLVPAARPPLGNQAANQRGRAGPSAVDWHRVGAPVQGCQPPASRPRSSSSLGRRESNFDARRNADTQSRASASARVKLSPGVPGYSRSPARGDPKSEGWHRLRWRFRTAAASLGTSLGGGQA